MSYGITPIAVQLSKVTRLLGSGDLSLLPAIRSRFAFRFEDPLWDEEAEVSLEGALQDLLLGKELHPDYGHLYAYAYELLCWHLGEHLSNECWSAMRGAWADTVDEALASAGVSKQVFGINNHLMFRGAPIQIPEPADFPFMGYLLASEVPLALKEIRSADLTSLGREVREAIEELRGWLETCQERGCDLMCFYY